MQDLASEFSQIFRGDTSGPSQREGETPSRTQHPVRPLTGRGAQAPWCWDPNLGLLNFSAVVAPLIDPPHNWFLEDKIIKFIAVKPKCSAVNVSQ